MDETFMLILLVIVMLVGSYLAGNIPLVVNWSQEKLRAVTILGAGLLVGTALTVIIPEGIRALYQQNGQNSISTSNGGFNDIQNLNIINKIPTTNSMMILSHNHNYIGNVPPFDGTVDTVKHEHQHNNNDQSSTIGLSLVLGFIFMMLVNQISQKRGGPNDKNITATLGLVVHAAADGVALGAAATTSHQDVEMIVFLAIMLHKAPAAFGLVSFLLHDGVDRQRIRKHLLIFSISAPLLTLLTYFGIGQEQKETLNSVNATGIAMLFSAGTFLYVATVHVLPELAQNSHSHSMHHMHHHHQNRNPNLPPVHYSHLDDDVNVIENGCNTNTNNNNKNNNNNMVGFKNSELLIMVFGALLPLVITFGHHH